MMYKQVHRRFTFVFTAIPALILVLMSVSCLYLSEQALYENSFLSFTQEMHTLAANLEQRTSISHELLARISRNGRYQIALYDDGVPLSYTKTILSPKSRALAEEALAIYAPPASQPAAFAAGQSGDYYVCCIKTQHPQSLTAVILQSTETFTEQIRRTRLRYLLVNAVGVLLLLFFAWSYTKRLLTPIQEAQKAQTAFIASASHELRTPLSVILSSICAAKCAPPEEQERFLQAAAAEGHRMSRLITDLLTLSRADSHTWSFRMGLTELDTLLLNACEAFEPLAGEKRFRLFAELAKDQFPPCCCDQERILQVVGILISNAVSYGSYGGFLKLRLDLQGGMFILQAVDNGCGISDEAKAHIFDRFYRTDTSRCEKDHLGLGLCIAQEIIKAHHGSIQVSDTPGGGATFTIRLPQHLPIR